MDFMVVTLASQCSFFDSYMGATYNIADLTRYDSCEMIFCVLTLVISIIRTADDPSYTVTDGDLPCTTQVWILLFFGNLF